MSRFTRVLAPLLFVPCLLFLSHCQKKQEDAPVTAQTSPPPGCCVVAPATGLSEGMGRIVVSYPGEAVSLQARIDLYKAGDTTSLGGTFGNYTVEMAPGLYDVDISGKRVAGVTVQAGHDTQVKVGVLHLHANSQTRIDLLGPAGGKPFTGDFGEASYGLPIGPVSIQVAGQSETVTITDGQITDFSRLGRLVIAYPDDAKTSGTRVDVYKAGETTSIAGNFGNYTPDLLPGSYDVEISGQRVGGVTVEPGRDTTVKVGVLRITADKNTRVELVDPTSGKGLTGDYGSRDYGLPIGPVSVQVAGQSETVTITEGTITEF